MVRFFTLDQNYKIEIIFLLNVGLCILSVVILSILSKYLTFLSLPHIMILFVWWHPLFLSLLEYEVNQDVNFNECVWLRILLRDFVFNVSLQAHILSNNVGVTSPTRTFSSQKKNNILSYHLTFRFEIL